MPRGHRIFRQPALTELQHEAAAARDLHGVGERLGHVREQLRHLLGRAQVLLLRVAARAALVREQRAVVDADARFVRFEVVRLQEAHVVGRDHRHAALRRQRHGGGDVGLLARPAEALQLDVEAIAEQLEPAIERLLGLALAAVAERAADVAFHAARRAR